VTRPDNQTTQSETRGPGRRWARRLAFAAAATLGAAVLALAALYGAAQTDAGRRWILARVAAAASTPGETVLSLKGLHGTLPQDLRLDRLALADRDGTWLTAENVTLVWHPLALLGGRFEVETLALDRLDVERAPAASGTAETGPRGLPSLPVALDVKRLSIQDLSLGAALLGTPARLNVLGEARAEPDGQVSSSLVVERRDGTPGRLAATARYRPQPESLGLDLRLSEPADGLVARLLALPDLPALSLTLSGDGPLAQWRGTLKGDAQSLGAVTAEVTLSHTADELGIGLVGDATLRPQDALLRRALAGTTHVALDARWQDGARLQIDRLTAENDALALSAAGRVDAGTLDGHIEADARLRDAALLAAVDPELAADSLDVKLASDGPLLQPHLVLDAEVAGLRRAPVGLRRGQLHATFDPVRPLDAGPPQGQLTASGRIEGLDAPAPAALLARLQPGFDWRLDGSLDLAANVLDLASAAVTGTGAALSGSGTLALDSGAFDAGATLALDDLADFSSLLGFDVAGAGKIETRLTNTAMGTATGTATGGALSGHLDGTFTALRLGEPVLQALFGATPKVASDFALTANGDLRLDALSLSGAAARITGDATIGGDFSALDARYQVTAKDLGKLSQALGVPLSGDATAEGTARGALADPALAGRLEVAKGSLAGTAFDRLTARYEIRDPASKPAGRISLAGSLPDLGAVEGETAFALSGAALDLSQVKLSALQTTATGDLSVPLDGAAITGQLALASPDIGAALAHAGLTGRGSLNGQLALRPGRTGQGATLTAELGTPRLTLDGQAAAAESLTLEVAAEDLLGTPNATATATLKAASLDALRLDTLRLTGQGTLEAADFTLAAKGDFDGPLALDAGGHVALAGKETTLRIARLEGQAFAQKIALRGPVTLKQGENTLALSALDLAFGAARVTADAALDAERLQLDAKVARLDLAALAPFGVPRAFTGRADGAVSIAGPRSAPRGDLSLKVDALRSADLPEGPAMTLDLTGRWQAGRLTLDGDLAGLPGKPATLTADLPLALAADSLTLSVPPQESISGRLAWRGDAATVWPLVPVSGHRLDGRLAVDMAVAGQVGNPRLSGQAGLSKGRYENLETGTILENLELQLDLEGERVVLTKLSASDGNGGKLTASGSAEIDPARHFPFDLKGEMTDFTAVRRDEVTAQASGTFGAEGDTTSALLRAKLETKTVELRIPEKLPPDVVDLNVVETGGARTQTASAAPAKAAAPPIDLRLDVAIDMPRRVFLRGRGLDSEWSGRFAITGPAEAPVVDGKLQIVRGQLMVLGKVFKLKRGQVTLPADAKIDPLLDIEAEHQGKSITVTATITGRASNPAFALSSVPELPRDEIVSRLLFDKGAGELSAVEAAQLAAALAELSGVGGGGGALMDRVRNLLGVDVLSVEAAKDGGAAPAIGAGKYLSDDVYVGVQKDVGSDTGSVEVEVELTPNISVQSGVESTGESDIGVEFKWDY